MRVCMRVCVCACALLCVHHVGKLISRIKREGCLALINPVSFCIFITLASLTHTHTLTGRPLTRGVRLHAQPLPENDGRSGRPQLVQQCSSQRPHRCFGFHLCCLRACDSNLLVCISVRSRMSGLGASVCVSREMQCICHAVWLFFFASHSCSCNTINQPCVFFFQCVAAAREAAQQGAGQHNDKGHEGGYDGGKAPSTVSVQCFCFMFASCFAAAGKGGHAATACPGVCVSLLALCE